MESTRNADAPRRLELLELLDLLNTDPEPAFDRLVRIALSVTGAETAMIAFIGRDRPWVRSRAGVPVDDAVLAGPFCAVALDGTSLLEVPDATLDARFTGHGAVPAPGGTRARVRAYASHPIVFEGEVLGTVCVLDSRPRTLDDAQRADLADLAGMVEALLLQRRQQVQLREERRHAVELAAALGESERMLAQAQLVARLGSWEQDLATGVFNWSAGMYAILERAPAQGPMNVEQAAAIVHPDDRDVYAAGTALAFEQRRPMQMEFRILLPDGRERWVDALSEPVLDERGEIVRFRGTVQDITERRRAEGALRESEARFRALTALSSDWYWELDEQLRLRNITGGLQAGNADEQRRLTGRQPWEAMGEGMDPAAWARHRAQLEAHQPFHDFEVTRREPGGTLQIVSISGEPVFDAAGAFTGYRGVGSDVTEQRRAQIVRQELEAQLRESQKMEAIGVLAGGIAHDFNNVLAGILGNVGLALQDLPAGDPVVTNLEQIRKASLRGRGLVQQILAFARRQPREISRCELRPLVEEAVGLLRATLPAGVTLEAVVCAQPLHAMADATQVEQVLMNLCTNAWHALVGCTGRIVVRLDAVERADGAGTPGAAALPRGRYACLSVQDNGRGMSPATRARIFEPFFTTKPVGEGTGLGLAVAHGIVAAHGGAIEVDTVEGEGSTFRIYLPLTDAPAPAERPVASAPVRRGHGERVLYIDDDEVMVVMVEHMLARLGYVPTCLRDPLAAIDAVRAAPSAFDAAVTDLNMPELSGLEVARELARIRPDLPVIISSGNLPEQLQSEAREAGVRALLHKQYTLEELGAVVHWVLSGGQRLGLEPLQASR